MGSVKASRKERDLTPSQVGARLQELAQQLEEGVLEAGELTAPLDLVKSIKIEVEPGDAGLKLEVKLKLRPEGTPEPGSSLSPKEVESLRWKPMKKQLARDLKAIRERGEENPVPKELAERFLRCCVRMRELASGDHPEYLAYERLAEQLLETVTTGDQQAVALLAQKLHDQHKACHKALK